MPVKLFFNRPCHVMFRQKEDGFTQVSIDGKDVASITRANVSFAPDCYPTVSITLAPAGCDVDLPDAALVIERLEAPESLQRALLEHLKAKYEPEFKGRAA